MKKILSVLVALLLLISIPASAASKSPKKVKLPKKTYVEKKVDIKLNAVLNNDNGNPVWKLTASIPKKGSTITFGWPLEANTKDQKSEFNQLLNKNSKISYKSGVYTITTEFEQNKFPNINEISFKAVMRAGNSHTTFVGKKTIELKNEAQPQPKTTTYDFKAEGIPSVIIPYQPITFPLTLNVAKDSSTVPDYVKINVAVTPQTQPSKILLTAGSINLIDTKQLGDPFLIDKNYAKKTDITAVFTEAGTYSATFTLVNFFTNQVLAVKTVNFYVYTSQSAAVQRIEIGKLKVTYNNTNTNLINLSVDRILVVYTNGATATINDFKYPIATIDINWLSNPNYSLPFNIVYNNTAYPFTLTSAQIINLWVKE